MKTGFIKEKAILLHEIDKELLAKLGKFAGAATSAEFTLMILMTADIDLEENCSEVRFSQKGSTDFVYRHFVSGL